MLPFLQVCIYIYISIYLSVCVYVCAFTYIHTVQQTQSPEVGNLQGQACAMIIYKTLLQVKEWLVQPSMCIHVCAQMPTSHLQCWDVTLMIPAVSQPGSKETSPNFFLKALKTGRRKKAPGSIKSAVGKIDQQRQISKTINTHMMTMICRTVWIYL